MKNINPKAKKSQSHVDRVYNINSLEKVTEKQVPKKGIEKLNAN